MRYLTEFMLINYRIAK